MRLVGVRAWRAIVLVLLAGCAASAGRAVAPSTPAMSTGRTAPAVPTARAVTLPPVHGRFSYQIGGAYAVPAGVTVVDRDRADPAAAGVYSICYVNAYQAQTTDVAWWRMHHPELLLRDDSGALVIDQDWNEPLFDISSTARRAALLGVVGGWLDGCASKGYRAVEADNLDSYTRSGGRLTAADALAFGRLLAARAHSDGLALGQKNAADDSVAAAKAGFDFAIAEECQVYSECGSYQGVYGAHLIEIEYTDQPIAAFTTACAARGSTVSVVLRDRDVVPAGADGHVERWC